MIPTIHPLGKTSIELRRSINRLEIFVSMYADDEFAPAVIAMIENLKEARRQIPVALRDQDLKENQ